jgi:uncharacterized protein (DUF934 family)
MPLIKDGRVADDPWLRLADDEALPTGAPAIVSLERWQAERESLAGRNAPLGLWLRSDQSPALVADDLDHFDLVALDFPKFNDGRAFSYARLLRERYGYRGELRAVGEVLRDLLLYMHRCGFDAFAIDRDDALERWEAALEEMSVWYQPTADGRPIVLRQRARGRQVESKRSAAAARVS